MVYPCGWWERNVPGCTCAYLDMLGYLLECGDPIFSKDRFLAKNVSRLRIDYIIGHELVKFVSKIHVDDGDGGRTEILYTDDHHGELHISEIIRVVAFRKMIPLVRYFLKHTLLKLHASRVNSSILKSLPLLAIKCLSWSNLAFQSSVVGVSSPTDATLVSYMYRGAHNQQRPRDLTQPAWQWQQRSGDLHAPERPSGFQGPEIFASAANAHVCPGATATEVDTRKRTRHISRMKERREYTEMLLLEATGLADEADRPRTPDPGDPALSSKRCWERAKIEWSVEINNVIAAARERDLEINTQGPHV